MDTLKAFAQRIQARAQEFPVSSPYRFGRFKVYIAALGLSESEKELLIQAHRNGLLELSRADLVPAMDVQLVKASEIRYMHAEFHFIWVTK